MAELAHPEGSSDARARRSVRVLVATSFFASLVWFVSMALRTPADTDEGFYAIAAELVAHGRMPYRDFFYPQAPLLPYVLGAFLKVFGAGFAKERVYAAILGSATATLISYAVHRETRSRLASALAVLLFCTHELSWQWVPTLRGYGVAGLAGIAAFVLVSDPARPPRPWQLFVAGVLVAFAPGSRLLLFPIIVGVVTTATLRHVRWPVARGLMLFVLCISLGTRELPPGLRAIVVSFVACAALAIVDARVLEATRDAAIALAGTLLVAGIVYLTLYRAAPDAFAFGNVGYHRIRAGDASAMYSAWNDSAFTAANMLGGGANTDLSAAGAQFALLLVFNAVSLALPNAALRVGPLLGVLLAFLVSLRPNPIHEHYFAPLVPYLALGAGVAVGHIFAALPTHTVRAQRTFAACLAAVYLLAGAASFTQKWVHGRYGPWDLSPFRPIALDRAARRVGDALRRHPGRVLAPWPGTAVGSAERIVPGFEDHFARAVAAALTREQRARWHVAGHTDFMLAIARRVPSVFVIDRESPGDPRQWLRNAAADARYRLDGRGDATIEIYVREP